MMAAPTELSTTVMTTYGTLFIAVIAGAFSLLGLVISKEQKVSEFRQSWIDSLREDVADLIAYANIIHSALLKFARVGLRDAVAFQSQNSENYIKVNRASSRIRLRLNDQECESQRLLEHIESLEQLLGKEPESLSNSQAEIEPINKRIQISAGVVLKSEWKRVKRGEWQYRVAKYVAILLFVVAIGLAILALRSAVKSGLFS